MSETRRNWTEEETTLAMGLYLQIPFKDISGKNSKIIDLAKLLNRKPTAVSFKMLNLASLDPAVEKMGKKGFGNRSKIDGEVWNKYYPRLDKLAIDYEKILYEYTPDVTEHGMYIIDTPGYDVQIKTTARIGQNLFRRNVLSQYKYKCCITGIPITEMLVASHIKPWARSNELEKIDSRNGLCLNPLHDKAFDIGLITINPDDYRIVYSEKLKKKHFYAAYEDYFGKYEGMQITLPNSELLYPNHDYMKYHYDEIFIE